MKSYRKPHIDSDKFFETNALACGKTPVPPAGSHHFGGNAYDTFTGHLGVGMGTQESVTGQAGIGFGPGGTSASYGLFGMCSNWVTLVS